jgi:enoyl-CoA hydratase/carnithine racemase
MRNSFARDRANRPFAPARRLGQMSGDIAWRRAAKPMNDISLILEPPIARLRLDRPDRRNVLSRAMWGVLPVLCAEIAATPEALVVVLEGSGDHFCAGADIREFAAVYRDAQTIRDFN